MTDRIVDPVRGVSLLSIGFEMLCEVVSSNPTAESWEHIQLYLSCNQSRILLRFMDGNYGAVALPSAGNVARLLIWRWLLSVKMDADGVASVLLEELTRVVRSLSEVKDEGVRCAVRRRYLVSPPDLI